MNPSQPTPLVAAPGVARFREGAAAHAFGVAALAAAAIVDTLPAWPVVVIGALSLVAHLLLWRRLHAVVEARREARPNGNRIAFFHTLLTFLLLGLACAWIAPVRSVALQMVTVAVAFDIHRLSQRQAVVIACAGLATLVWALPGLGGLRAVDVVTVVACLVALACVGQRTRSIDRRQRAQRAALSNALAELQALSRHDALTGALCRRHGTELLQQEAERQHRDGRPFCVGLLDADHFKRINDLHGHALGDAVLVALVQRITASIGAPNHVVRWGGEEFLLLLPATDLVAATALLRGVRDAIATHDWSRHAAGLVVDVSIGVAEHRPGTHIDASVARADAALYTAKAEGRGRVVADAR